MSSSGGFRPQGNRLYLAFKLAFFLAVTRFLLAEPPSASLPQRAREAMLRAAHYYHDHVAIHGGYPYYSSLNLQERWGEGTLPPQAIVVQPPGTPTVGMSFLKAYEATGDKFYLAAAQHAAEALVRGRLTSGGWSQVIQFDAEGKFTQPRKQHSSLDDGQTQSALQLLMLTDQALEFKNTELHRATLAALQALLQAQFPCGAFPQVWTAPVAKHPIQRAKFPNYDWKTEGRVKNYWDYYTLNDNLAGSVAETLILAHRIYGEDQYLAALLKLGDFLLLAQMPEPQPAWCQQYNYDMHPIWARKFEPPAITGWESQDAMRTLLAISAYTGEKKYLETVPRALEYLRSCLLPDGRIARYYELGTNKPLYMTREYQLTYDDSHVPRHYGWKQPAKLDLLAQQYQAVLKGESLTRASRKKPSDKEVLTILEQLDAQGRWVSVYQGESLTGHPTFTPGFQYLSSDVFSRHLEKLSEYVATEK